MPTSQRLETKSPAQQSEIMTPTAWALLVLLSVLWGGAFFFVGVAVVELPPLTVVFARVGIAATGLVGLTLFLGYRLPRRLSAWTPFLIMGLLNNAVPFSFLSTGQTIVSVGLASIINGMTPLFTALVMASYREERLTIHRAVGVLLGVGGVVLISHPDADMADTRLLGIGLCLAATLSYGFAALWGRRHLSNVPPLTSATCQLISSTLIMTVVVAIVDRPWTLSMPSTEVWMALCALALLGTAVAYVVFFEILSRAGASNAMLVTLLIPVTALLLGNLFLAEPILIYELAGAVTIGLGLLFIDGRIPRRVMRVVSERLAVSARR